MTSSLWYRRLPALCLLLLITCFAAANTEPLRVWTSLDGESLEWLRSQSDTFAQYFEVDVEIEEYTLGELRDRAVETAAEGRAGDLLVGVPHTQLSELAAEGILSDLSAFATSAYLEDLSTPARDAFTVAGELLGLPIWVEGPALIVNEELLADLPTSYGEFIEEVAALTEGDDFGFAFDVENLYYSYAWFDTFGGYLFGQGPGGRPDPSDVGLASGESVRAALELRALRFEHGLLPEETGYGATTRLFLAGNLAATYDGPWAAARFQNAGIDIEVTSIPRLHGDTAWSGFVGATGVLLNDYGERRVDAVNLAKWLVRSEAQVELARKAFRVPASLTAASLADDPHIAGFARALANGTPIPGIPEMGRVWQPAGAALSRIMSDPDANVRDLLEAAVRGITANR